MSNRSALRVLAICSRPLVDQTGEPIVLLDIAEERRRIETGIRNSGDAATVTFLPEATTGAVKSALRNEWDIVHFTGHGASDGLLLLEDGFGAAHLLSNEEMSQLFSQQKAPLVILSACHSETAARALHASGVPAVVAIDARVPIADLAAIIFAEHFYSALAKGWDVRRAFDDAQQTVALDPRVGDGRPPVDEHGKSGEPWSNRFLLIGDAEEVTFSADLPHLESTPTRAETTGNLRTLTGNFVGRATEIVSVIRAFDQADARRVTVYGAGGLGKTELARAVGRWYMERERVGAVLWASASHVEGEYKLRDLASLLGIAARVFQLPITEQSLFEEQKKVVRDFLASNGGFLLLDNWETIEPQHRRELWDFVLGLSEDVRVLVTSRDVLPATQARNIELDTLAQDDAVDMFVRIARNAAYFERNPNVSRDELAILKSICERLGGYPLAIEVVAGQTVSRTLGEIWADLQRVPRDVLEGKDEVTGEPRGIWTSLDLSFDVLPAPEQMVFRQVCVFLAPASGEDIAAIIETANARHLLDNLVKRSLVRVRDGSYSLLPIVRDYAIDKLKQADDNLPELHFRAAQHYSQKGAIEDALKASDHLLELITVFGLRDVSEAFVSHVRSFYMQLVTRGYWVEARTKAEQTIAVARMLGDKQIEARFIGELGSRYQDIGEYDRALAQHGKAQHLLEEVDDAHGVSASLHQQAMIAQVQGKYEEAVRLYEQSRDIDRDLGDERGVAISLHELGTVAHETGDLEKASLLYQESLQLKEKLNDQGGIASTLHQLGILAQARKDFVEAARLYRQSLAIREKLGDKHGLGLSMGQLGRLSLLQGDPKTALAYTLDALVIFAELNAPYLALTLKHLQAIRKKIGAAEFSAWLRELSPDADQIEALLAHVSPMIKTE